MNRYVVVQISDDTGVDAVYVGPDAGWQRWEVLLAKDSLAAWLSTTEPDARLVIMDATPMPDTPRGTMARAVMDTEIPSATEADAAVERAEAGLRRARAALFPSEVRPSVEAVDPPWTELWDTIRDTVTPDEVEAAIEEVKDGSGAFSLDDVGQRLVEKRREDAP